MEIHRNNACRSRCHKKIRNELGRNRSTRGDLAILPCIAVVRDHRSDFLSARSLERVDHDERFHQSVVHRTARTLDHVDVSTANVLADLDKDLTVAKASDFGMAERLAEFLTNFLSERAVGVSRQNDPVSDAHGLRTSLVAEKSQALAGPGTLKQ